MKQWQVAGGVIEHQGRVLLVENERRNGSFDWSPPGGVVDPGESVLSALTREVVEETGIVVASWARHLYSVTVEAPDLGWHMTASIHLSGGHEGDIAIDDPDGIVTQARWVERHEISALVVSSPRWLHEPLLTWTSDPWADGTQEFNYQVLGADRASFQVIRLA
jgi:8-oxo-dGTP diphosphatase